MSRRRDLDTTDLFDWQPPQVAVGYGEEVTGRGPLDMKISRLVAKALQDSRDDDVTRGEIAARISRYLNRKVSRDMLDKWSAPGAVNHRIKLDEFAALIEATGKTALLGFLPSLFGFAVVADEYKDMIRLHEMKEHRKRVAAHETQIEADIAALEARVRGRR